MANSIFVLIIIFGTSTNAGGFGLSQEFYSRAACLSAGKALLSDMTKHGRTWVRVASWGCFKKGEWLGTQHYEDPYPHPATEKEES